MSVRLLSVEKIDIWLNFVMPVIKTNFKNGSRSFIGENRLFICTRTASWVGMSVIVLSINASYSSIKSTTCLPDCWYAVLIMRSSLVLKLISGFFPSSENSISFFNPNFTSCSDKTIDTNFTITSIWSDLHLAKLSVTTGYSVHSCSSFSIFVPLNSSFFPSKYDCNVLTNSDLPKRRGRDRK